MHYPDWLSVSFYEELTAEVRTDKGWTNPSNARNESFDLYGYAKGVTQAFMLEKQVQSIDWENPPAWAAELSNNTQIDLIVEEKTPTKKQQNKQAISMGNPFDAKDGWGF